MQCASVILLRRRLFVVERPDMSPVGVWGAGNAEIIAVISFFFSSRRRHTRFDCDWSSDVCSSDLWVERTFERRCDACLQEQAEMELPVLLRARIPMPTPNQMTARQDAPEGSARRDRKSVV